MATIRDKLGHRCFEAARHSVSGESDPVPQGRLGVIQSQGVAFAVGRRSRTDFAFGASVALSDEMSERPEKTGDMSVSNARIASLNDASISHYQRESEPRAMELLS